MVRLTYRLAMTIAVDMGGKATKQKNCPDIIEKLLTGTGIKTK